MAPTRTPPGSLWRATASSPALAMQPHCAQSGVPPNWQGVIRRSRSADRLVVV